MNYYANMNSMWAGACKDLHARGGVTQSRAGLTTEVVGWCGTLNDIDQNVLLTPLRKMDPAYACAELLWYVGGSGAVRMLCEYAPSYKRFANPQTVDGVAHGAYGARWSDNPGFHAKRGVFSGQTQLDAVVELLTKRPDSRQAVVTMWDSGDLHHAIEGDVNDVPCTVSMQFLLRDKRLHCVTYMRSNDVWLGMPYDVFCFTSLQRVIANRLMALPGRYVHCVGSLHAYHSNFDKGFSLATAGAMGPAAKYSNAAHGYAIHALPTSEAAVDNERAIRESVTEGKAMVVDLGPGGLDPLSDAAILCARKLTKGAIGATATTPALERAWDLKYGGAAC